MFIFVRDSMRMVIDVPVKFPYQALAYTIQIY